MGDLFHPGDTVVELETRLRGVIAADGSVALGARKVSPAQLRAGGFGSVRRVPRSKGGTSRPEKPVREKSSAPTSDGIARSHWQQALDQCVRGLRSGVAGFQLGAPIDHGAACSLEAERPVRDIEGCRGCWAEYALAFQRLHFLSGLMREFEVFVQIALNERLAQDRWELHGQHFVLAGPDAADWEALRDIMGVLGVRPGSVVNEARELLDSFNAGLGGEAVEEHLISAGLRPMGVERLAEGLSGLASRFEAALTQGRAPEPGANANWGVALRTMVERRLIGLREA